MKVTTVNEMRALEERAEAMGLPGPALMEIAGRAFSDAVEAIWDPIAGRRIVVMVGPGNNGGDGLVAARWFALHRARVIVALVVRPLNVDAKIELVRELGVPILEVSDDWTAEHLTDLFLGADLVIDALLGIGRIRPIAGIMAEILQAAAESHVSVVALDFPSGLNADSGECDPRTIAASITISLGGVKHGLLINEGARLAGHILPVEIGIPEVANSSESPCWLSGRALLDLVPRRDRLGHKGTNGKVLVIAGSDRYVGAPLLAARGAARIGAGLITLAAPAGVASASGAYLIEITLLPMPGSSHTLGPDSVKSILAVLPNYDAVILGPGLGQGEQTTQFLREILGHIRGMSRCRTVLDADALNILAREPNWWGQLPADSIITPHPLEMARLMGVDRISGDRMAIAQQAAATWGVHIVLKGAYSVIASPDRSVAICPSAKPVLSSAGTGDVLSGAIGGLLALGFAPQLAARAGVVFHAAAGEIARRTRGEAGVIASEIADLLPLALREIQAGIDPWGARELRQLLNPKNIQ